MHDPVTTIWANTHPSERDRLAADISDCVAEYRALADADMPVQRYVHQFRAAAARGRLLLFSGMFSRVPPRNDSLVPVVLPPTVGETVDGEDAARDEVSDLPPFPRLGDGT
jgi:hypothetical protein